MLPPYQKNHSLLLRSMHVFGHIRSEKLWCHSGWTLALMSYDMKNEFRNLPGILHTEQNLRTLFSTAVCIVEPSSSFYPNFIDAFF